MWWWWWGDVNPSVYNLAFLISITCLRFLILYCYRYPLLPIFSRALLWGLLHSSSPSQLQRGVEGGAAARKGQVRFPLRQGLQGPVQKRTVSVVVGSRVVASRVVVDFFLMAL